MADVKAAIQFVLRQEDSRLTGNIKTLPGDRGGATRFGLASASHPDLVEEGYFEVVDGEPAIQNDEALEIADTVYSKEYAEPILLAQVSNQDVANHMLSFAINEGPVEATMILQRALNSIGAIVLTDGKTGPATIAAVNAAMPDQLIAALRSFQRQFYRNLVAAQPALLPCLQGLLNRADA